MKKIQARKRRVEKKKFIHRGFGCLMLIILLLQVRVQAGMNDTVIEKHRMDGIYAVAKVGGVDHLYYLNMYKMNGRVAYCIDIGVDITTDIYHSTADFSVSNLTNEQIEYIQMVSYYGYEYYEHTDYRYYMAAQELIWEYLSGIQVEWTNVLDVNGERINTDNYKRHILAFKEYYSRTIQFDFEDGQVLELGQEISLVDQSGVLDSYEVVSMGHSWAEIEGNTLRIKVGTDYVGSDSILLKKKGYYSYDSTLYYYDNSQRLISNGNFNLKEKEIVWNTKGTILNVQLVDKNTKAEVALGEASLEGATYELYRSDGQLIESFITDDLGQAVVTNLPYGSYYVKQTKASEGYLLNEEFIEFEIAENQVSLVLEQEVISNIIELVKYFGDAEEGKMFVEENISFSVYDGKAELFDTIITNELGYAEIWLPYGKYLFQQVNSSYGYAKVDDFEVKVEEVLVSNVHYNLFDSPIQCKISLKTKDMDTQLSILGDGNSYRIRNKNSLTYLEYQGEDTFLANEQGELVFPMKIPYGDYVIEQVQVVDGYVRDNQGLEITIGEHTDFEILKGELWWEVEFYNRLIKGEVDILTNQEIFVGGDNQYKYLKEIRQGIEIGLFAAGDIYENGNLIYQADEQILSVETNGEGNVVVSDLPLGEYCLVESISGIKGCFTLATNRDDVLKLQEEVELTLELEKIDVLFENISEIGEEIKGSIFEFYDEEDNLIYTGVTDEEGKIKIKDLPQGVYYYSQINVPSEYILDSSKNHFEILELFGDKEVQFVNLLAPKRWIEVPNTFQDRQGLMKLILLVILGIIGIGVMTYRKRNRQNNCS